MHARLSALALLLFAALPAQARVFIGGVPTNLSLDLSSTAAVVDPTAGDAFFALMPIQGPSFSFAVFDSVPWMNYLHGTGNWLRCTMTATHWAYLWNDACAHQPALGATAPLSLLTSDYDLGGIYSGVPGTPDQPWPGATMFIGAGWPSTMSGNVPILTWERWQLRTSDFWGQPWNACPPIGASYANFSGWLIARFTFSFQ